MRVVLAAINAKYIHSNLAVYSLKASAGMYEGNISIAEYTINQQTDDILMDLYGKKPDILCFSCYIWNISYIEVLVQELKKILPDTEIWLGGPEVSYDAKLILTRLSEVRGVVKGEGEETFPELLQFWAGDGGDLRSIKGVSYRETEGAIVENEWRSPVDLSDVPFVYKDMKDFEHKIIYYETSRGCPFSCSYCLSSIDKRLRFRSMELVKEELRYFIDQKVPQVKFVDRTFNCSHSHAVEIWTFLRDHDNGVTNFHFEVAADLLNEDELRLMETMRPGLIQLEIGVQSTNEQTIREIRRSMDFEKVAEIVTKIRGFGNIHQHLDLIAGLPYEGYESFGRSFDNVYRLRPHQLQLGFLKVLKGSYMETQAQAYELVFKSVPPYEVLSTKWLSYEDVVKLKRIEEMVEIYYNSGQFTNTLKRLEKAFSSPFQMFEALSAFYEENGLCKMSHSRITRYEILLAFAKKHDAGSIELYRELLTFDLYLRENIKNRPAFAGEWTVDKKEQHEFYETGAGWETYLTGYEKYDKRQVRKMTHLEKFAHDITGNLEEQETMVLFDYLNKSPLTKQAEAYKIDI